MAGISNEGKDTFRLPDLFQNLFFGILVIYYC